MAPSGAPRIRRSPWGISTLHEATGGDPASSPRWHEHMAYGGDQEMIAVLRTPHGDAWGALGLYREPGQPLFDPAELELVRVLAPHLAEGGAPGAAHRRGQGPEGPDAPSCSRTAGRSSRPRPVPTAGSRSSRTATGTRARCRHPSSPWRARRCARPSTPDEPGEAAVIVEPAHPARISPLLMSAYGLTTREQDVTRLALQGDSTTEIADRLVVSAHTVEQHLKTCAAGH